MAELLLVTELADRAGVAVETVRFCERQRLLPALPRSDSKYRRYPAGLVPRVRFVDRARQLGLTIDEIRSLLALRDRKGGATGVRDGAKATVDVLRQRIVALERLCDALTEVARKPEQPARDSGCPILTALDDGEG